MAWVSCLQVHQYGQAGAAWNSLVSAWVVEAWVVPWLDAGLTWDVAEGQACYVLAVVAGSCHRLQSCGDPYTSCYLSCVDYDCSTCKIKTEVTQRSLKYTHTHISYIYIVYNIYTTGIYNFCA